MLSFFVCISYAGKDVEVRRGFCHQSLCHCSDNIGAPFVPTLSDVDSHVSSHRTLHYFLAICISQRVLCSGVVCCVHCVWVRYSVACVVYVGNLGKPYTFFAIMQQPVSIAIEVDKASFYLFNVCATDVGSHVV